MRILVFSDSHGSGSALERAVAEQPQAKSVIFLGDGENEFDTLPLIFGDRDFYAVRGNCDFSSSKPSSLLIEIGGKKIFATHGHVQGVKSGIGGLISTARLQCADIALFGHTHAAMTSYEDGIYIMNPGSVSRPSCGHASYGIIDILPSGILSSVITL